MGRIRQKDGQRDPKVVGIVDSAFAVVPSSPTTNIKQEYISDSDSEPDECIARRQPIESTRGVKLIPRSVSNQEARRLTRSCQVRPATTFTPRDPLMIPEMHFPLQTATSRTRFPRFVNRFNSREIMLVVDGSCMNNGARVGRNPASNEEDAGRASPSAGASFLYKNTPSYLLGSHPTTMPFLAAHDHLAHGGAALGDITIPMSDITGKIALRLERQGPRGDVQTHTSNRAKLRAVIAALDFRPWHGEGWERIVVVTDLEYVAIGATRWMPLWAKRRWRSSPSRMKNGKIRCGKKIANRDLWEELQSRIEMLRANGSEVSFWLVPTKSLLRKESVVLREAKTAAQEAARNHTGNMLEEYTQLCGVFV